MEKLNFYEWFGIWEREPGEKPSTDWIKQFSNKTAWESYRYGTPVHDGDCTQMPYSCSMCNLTYILNEYRDYFFGRGEYEQKCCRSCGSKGVCPCGCFPDDMTNSYCQFCCEEVKNCECNAGKFRNENN